MIFFKCDCVQRQNSESIPLSLHRFIIKSQVYFNNYYKLNGHSVSPSPGNIFSGAGAGVRLQASGPQGGSEAIPPALPS